MYVENNLTLNYKIGNFLLNYIIILGDWFLESNFLQFQKSETNIYILTNLSLVYMAILHKASIHFDGLFIFYV